MCAVTLTLVGARSYAEFLGAETKREWKWQKQNDKELDFWARAVPFVGSEPACDCTMRLQCMLLMYCDALHALSPSVCIALRCSDPRDPGLGGGGARQLHVGRPCPAVLCLGVVQVLVEVACDAGPTAYLSLEVCHWWAFHVVLSCGT